MATRTVKIDGIEFEVEYEYCRACRGAREPGTGIQLEPDEESGVEVEGIKTSDDIMELLNEELIDRIAGQICSAIEEPGDEY